MYTRKLRILAGASLLIALMGLLNLWVIKATFLGLAANKVAILTFIPAFFVTLMAGMKSHAP